MGDSNPQHPDLESGALPLELIAYNYLLTQVVMRECVWLRQMCECGAHIYTFTHSHIYKKVKLFITVSSLYELYALYTIYSIYVLKIFLCESFCS